MRVFSVSVLVVLALCTVCAVSSMSVYLERSKEIRTNDFNSVMPEEVQKNETGQFTEESDYNVVVPVQQNKCANDDCDIQSDNTDSEGISENRALGEARKRKNKKKQDLMSRILPMMVIPFMIQTAMIPMVLTTLKFMLIKSAFIGKLAIILGLLNALRRSQNGGGVYSHNVNVQEDTKKLHQMHYGYYGAPEYGAWINR